jgi:CRP/FNR family transcriptional regulator, cyclic AMP receptor protein
MQCASCGAETGGRHKFCTQCGTRLALRCANCGFASSPGDTFCGDCGAALSTPAEIIPPTPRCPSLQQNTNGAGNGQLLLERCSLFRGLDPDARRQLAAHAHRFRFGAGEVIFEAGSPGQSMIAVAAGTVRVTARSARGYQILLIDLSPGEVFGEIALLADRGRTANAIALTSCELLVLERRDIRPFLERRPEICLKLLETLGRRLRGANARITEFAFSDLDARLSKTLLRLTNGTGSKVGTSQRELATLTGATQQSVNRCLREWHRSGLVRLHEGGIALADLEALARIARTA